MASKSLVGKTVFITGASRGIGLAIAKKCASEGANVVIAAKTAKPHPKLPGTIYTAAKEVEAAGGKCLPCIVDVRSEEQVQRAIDETVKTFGGLDIVINNAGAIYHGPTEATLMKRYDLLNDVNVRAAYMCSKLAIPHLRKSSNSHILNLSPPLNMRPDWFNNRVAYTISKYGMTLVTVGLAEELKKEGIAVNSLWPRTIVHTSAAPMDKSRSPLIMADAAFAILTRDSRSFTGNICIDDEILHSEGITNLDKYSYDKEGELILDIYVDSDPYARPRDVRIKSMI